MSESEQLLERIYPEFPAQEYEVRNAAAKAAMDKHGLDALFVTMRENVEYFTGYVYGHRLWALRGMAAGVGIIPREGEAVLVIPDFLRGTAERTAWVRNMRRHPNTHTKPRDFANAVIDAFREMGLERGRIGYESGPELSLDMPIVDFEAVRASLKDASFVSGSDVIWACRSHKSPLEIERLERANEITFKGYEEARRTVRVGMTEKEIAQVFTRVFLEEGEAGYTPNGLASFNIRAGAERYPMADSLPQERKIQAGDLLSMNLGASWRSYCGHTARYAFVGEPTEEHRRVDALIGCIRDAMAEFLKPGIDGAELAKYVKAAVAESDSVFFPDPEFGSQLEAGRFPVSGVSTGMNSYEHPRIGETMPECVEPGLSITMSCWIYDVGPGGMGLFSWGHPFIVTETGNRPLVPEHLREEVWII